MNATDPSGFDPCKTSTTTKTDGSGKGSCYNGKNGYHPGQNTFTGSNAGFDDGVTCSGNCGLASNDPVVIAAKNAPVSGAADVCGGCCDLTCGLSNFTVTNSGKSAPIPTDASSSFLDAVINFVEQHGEIAISLGQGTGILGTQTDIVINSEGVFLRVGVGIVGGDGAIVAVGGHVSDTGLPPYTGNGTGFGTQMSLFGSADGELPGPGITMNKQFGFSAFPQVPSIQSEASLGGGFGVGDVISVTVGYTFKLFSFDKQPSCGCN